MEYYVKVQVDDAIMIFLHSGVVKTCSIGMKVCQRVDFLRPV